MPRKFRIGVDIDSVCVDSHYQLARKLIRNEFAFQKNNPDIFNSNKLFDDITTGSADYWLTKYVTAIDEADCTEYELDMFGEARHNAIESIFDYYRDEHLYDHMTPIPAAVTTLQWITNNYDVEIVFITAIKGNHHKSKYAFMERFFPFEFGFIATKEKYLVDVDVMIDDRAENLIKFEDTRLILFPSLFKNEVDITSHRDFVGMYGWEEIKDYLKTIMVGHLK